MAADVVTQRHITQADIGTVLDEVGRYSRVVGVDEVGVKHDGCGVLDIGRRPVRARHGLHTVDDVLAVAVAVIQAAHTVGDLAAARDVDHVTALAAVEQERQRRVLVAQRAADTQQPVGLTVTDVEAFGGVDDGIAVHVTHDVAVRVTHVVLT